MLEHKFTASSVDTLFLKLGQINLVKANRHVKFTKRVNCLSLDGSLMIEERIGQRVAKLIYVVFFLWHTEDFVVKIISFRGRH